MQPQISPNQDNGPTSPEFFDMPEEEKGGEQEERETSPIEISEQMIAEGEELVDDVGLGLQRVENIAQKQGAEVDPNVTNELEAEADEANIALDILVAKAEQVIGQEKTKRKTGRTKRVTKQYSSVETNALPQPVTEMNEMEKEILSHNISSGVNELYQLVIKSKENPEARIEEIKTQLRSIMEAMHEFTMVNDPILEANRPLHQRLLLVTMDKLNTIKKMAGNEISRAFSEIYLDYTELIDGEIIIPLEQTLFERGETTSIEHLTKKVYERTPEELEAIKQINRDKVVYAIMEMKEQPDVTVEMIQDLHRINNRGIVPEKYSHFREKVSDGVVFGRRVGILGPDVLREVSDVVMRANILTYKKIFSNMGEGMYEVAAARLHNDLLDIHPFFDRNGSTALLFLELLMARQGYEPPTTREKDYYEMLGKIFGHNLLAMGVVAHQQFKIGYQLGHYQGITPEEPVRQGEYGKRLAARKKLLADNNVPGLFSALLQKIGLKKKK